MQFIKRQQHSTSSLSRYGLPLSSLLVVLFLSACSSTPSDKTADTETVDVSNTPVATGVSEDGVPAGFDATAPDINPYLAEKTEGPSAARGLFRDAIASMQQENWQRAEVLLQQLTTEYPKLSGPFLNLGIVYRQLERSDDAETAFKNAIAANGLNLDAYNQLGLLLREQGRFTDAEAQYQKAISVWPKHAPSHKNLGILYDLYLGQFPKALQHFEIYQYLQNEPDREMAGWIIDLKRRIGS